MKPKRKQSTKQFKSIISFLPYLKIIRPASWARLNEIPLGPEIYREVWIDNEKRWGDSVNKQLFDVPEVDAMWDEFGRIAELLIKDHRSIKWEQIPSNELMILYELEIWVYLGIQSLPEISENLIPHQREALFFDTLIHKAVLDRKGKSRPLPKAAFIAYLGYLLGPAVKAEIERRGSGHVGTYAAILKLVFASWESNSKIQIDLEDSSWTTAQKNLVRIISRKLTRRIESYPDWQREEIRSEIPDRIWEALKTQPEYAGMDPFEALEANLGRKLNIFPQRVADRMRNFLRSGIDRHLRKQEPLNPQIQKEQEETELIKNPGEVKRRIKDTEGKLDEELLCNEFLEKYPKHKEIWPFLLSDETIGSIAAKLGVSERAVYLKKEECKKDFKGYLGTPRL